MAPAYDWYQEGLTLLSQGAPRAAAAVLEKAVVEEPDKGSIREALGRAYYGTGSYGAAFDQFSVALDISPANDYAHFGVGLCLGRLGRLDEACGHLKMANVMRPDIEHYEHALTRHELRRRIRSRPPGEDGTRE